MVYKREEVGALASLSTTTTTLIKQQVYQHKLAENQECDSSRPKKQKDGDQLSPKHPSSILDSIYCSSVHPTPNPTQPNQLFTSLWLEHPFEIHKLLIATFVDNISVNNTRPSLTQSRWQAQSNQQSHSLNKIPTSTLLES